MRARLQLALVIGLLIAAVLIIGAWSAGEDARYLNPVEMALSRPTAVHSMFSARRATSCAWSTSPAEK